MQTKRSKIIRLQQLKFYVACALLFVAEKNVVTIMSL